VPNEVEEREVVELLSLGIEPRKRTELNDKKELAELAENLKQAMLQDYRTAYSGIGHKCERETKAILTP
jgi:hypothetical protein